jgi:hypothetical protein
MLKNIYFGAEDIAQWWDTCLVYVHPEMQKQNKKASWLAERKQYTGLKNKNENPES